MSKGICKLEVHSPFLHVEASQAALSCCENPLATHVETCGSKFAALHAPMPKGMATIRSGSLAYNDWCNPHQSTWSHIAIDTLLWLNSLGYQSTPEPLIKLGAITIMEGQSFGDMPAQRACPKKIIQLCVTMIPAWPHFTLYNDTHTCHFGQRGYDLS